MRALVRVDPDHHCHHEHPPTASRESGTAAGMPYYSAGARASFEPHHGKTPAGQHLDLKPGHTRPAGGSGASPPGPLNATARLTAIPARSATPTTSLNKAARCAFSLTFSITQ